jgi:uncharacterized protein (DUF1330 family)
MVPAEGGCSVLSGGGSVAQALFSVFGAEILVVGAKVGQLGGECCLLAGEALDLLHKCVAVEEWHDARELRLGGSHTTIELPSEFYYDRIN